MIEATYFGPFPTQEMAAYFSAFYHDTSLQAAHRAYYEGSEIEDAISDPGDRHYRWLPPSRAKYLIPYSTLKAEWKAKVIQGRV